MDLASPWIASQPHPATYLESNKAGTMSFLVVFVAPEMLQISSRGPEPQYPGL